jgi:hypothetical protein
VLTRDLAAPGAESVGTEAFGNAVLERLALA